MESYKNIIMTGIIALALVVCAFTIKTGMENSKKISPPEAFTLYGYEGVLYRLNSVNGRLDVLVPSNEAALLFPVGQMQLPRADAKLTDEQKTSWTTNIKTIAQYIQGERARSLGTVPAPDKPSEQK